MKKRWLVATAIWLAIIVAGLGYLLVYDYTPGKDTGSPPNWPAASGLAHSTTRPSLIMFAHPQCPCTRASIEELARLMASCQGQLDAQVLFVRPKGESDAWMQSDLWQSAAAIPGVTVRSDDAGRAAQAFGAVTSGRVVLYDAQGRLLFQGGITDGRGHAGDNEGRDDIVALLNHGQPQSLTTPTFGCSLVSSGSTAPPAICTP